MRVSAILILTGLVLFGGNAALAAPPGALAGPAPGATKITVSAETTILLGPREADGTVDYVAAINQALGRGVTAQNNAAVILAPLMELRLFDRNTSQRVQQLLKALGTVDQKSPWIYWRDFNHLPPDSRNYPLPIDTPWGEADHPDVAAWLTANEAGLALLHLPAARNRFFIPLIPGELNSLIDSDIHAAYIPREIIDAWHTRIWLRISRKDWRGAWQDLYDLHRLAHLYGRRGDLGALLVGANLERFAMDRDVTLLDQAGDDKQLAGEMLKCLLSLEPLQQLSEFWRRRQQFDFPDKIELVARQDTEMLKQQGGRMSHLNAVLQANGLPPMLPDFDEALRRGNALNTQIVHAPEWKTAAEEVAWAGELDRRVKSLQAAQNNGGPAGFVVPLPNDTVKSYSDRFGEGFWAVSMPTAPGSLALQLEEARERFNMTIVACAACAYRADTGRYPDRPADLAPKYLPEPPVDLYGQPLQIRRLPQGTMLQTSQDAVVANSVQPMVIRLPD